MQNKPEISPMMEQYLRIKEQNKDNILFYRVGDFYEMFYDDAKLASEELDLYLTAKDCGKGGRAPMCGVPYHSCEAYIGRLVEKGYKVAICEQTEDPSAAKKLVDREVVRVITPGTVIEDSLLDESRNNYLAALAVTTEGAGICFTDASTGECHVTAITPDGMEKRIQDEVMRFRPSEILITEGLQSVSMKIWDFLQDKNRVSGMITVRSKACFDPAKTESMMLDLFEISSLSEIGLAAGSVSAAAIGAAIGYLCETGRSSKISVNHVDVYTDKQFMRLDLAAVQNLELTETMRTKSKRGSLLWVIDKTKTAMGKRLMRSWVEKPLINLAEIQLRQNAVDELCSDTVLRGEIITHLAGVKDVERAMTKMVYGSALPREMLAIRDTARAFPGIKTAIQAVKGKMLRTIEAELDTLEDVEALISASINEKAPNTVKEGKLIRKGYHPEVDELNDIIQNGGDYIAKIETRERERTGIKNLRVRYNKVFGYYIEVTNSFLEKVPEEYVRRQTLTNCERFVTEELKELEKRILTAKDRVVALEYDLFNEIRQKIAAEVRRFQQTAAAIARLDVLCSLAEVSAHNRYCRPLVNNGGTISIKAGRHPVVEKVIRTPFVTNDTFLNTKEDRCSIITGPNMAGKSTYMRQTAVIVLMAQMGCFVPADMAEIGIVDAIFTRVGASDDLAAGQSTFMVEMSEVADILKNATKNSLLILDEIGRGTSTFDGMSIARAVLEFVADKRKLGAKTLFATHYHELTEMENELSGVKNYNVAVKKRGDDIIFLRRIVRGGADDSYGIEVAKLSGIPDTVIERAKEILKKTEEEGIVTYKTVADPGAQLSLAMQSATSLLEELQQVDVNIITPIEAMQILSGLVEKAKAIS